MCLVKTELNRPKYSYVSKPNTPLELTYGGSTVFSCMLWLQEVLFLLGKGDSEVL